MEQRSTGLTWGLKESFVRYLMTLADSGYFDEDGATFVEPNLFHFVLDDQTAWDFGTNVGILKFRGKVTMRAHEGVLFVSFQDPWVEFGPMEAQLSVIDPDSDTRVRLGILEREEPTDVDGRLVWSSLPVRLAPESVGVFNWQYPESTELAPLSIVALVR